MTHIRAKNQGVRPEGSKARVETNGRTRPIAVPCPLALTRSVNRNENTTKQKPVCLEETARYDTKCNFNVRPKVSLIYQRNQKLKGEKQKR